MVGFKESEKIQDFIILKALIFTKCLKLMLASQMKNFCPQGFLNLSGPLKLKASVRHMFGWGKSPINNKMTGVSRFKVQDSIISNSELWDKLKAFPYHLRS